MSCSVESCTDVVRAYGYCEKHYRRLVAHGDPLWQGINRERPKNYRQRGGWKETKQNEHRSIVEKILGKPLPAGALVHHVNEDKLDNRPSNLVVCPSVAYHLLLHKRMRAYDACGHADWLRCSKCKSYDLPSRIKRYAHVGGCP